MSTTLPISQDFSLSDPPKSSRNRKSKGKNKNRKSGKKKGVAIDDWASWSSHLASRKSPTDSITVFGSGKKSPLLWSAPDELQPESLALLESLYKPRRSVISDLIEQMEPWLAEANGRESSAEFALECLAWGHAMPKLAARADAESWWRMLDQLIAFTADAAGIDVDVSPLPQQLLAGELPLTLAWLFPEVQRCRDLAPPAREALARGIEELLDGEGLPHARHLDL